MFTLSAVLPNRQPLSGFSPRPEMTGYVRKIKIGLTQFSYPLSLEGEG